MSEGLSFSAAQERYPLQYWIGESVWLAGPVSYLVRPSERINYSDPCWRDVWYVSQGPVPIVGVRLSLERLWYLFPGGGNNDGRSMFRDRIEALRAAERHNETLEGRTS